MGVKSWEVSDAFWARVEALIPEPERDSTRTYKRARGAGRKRKPPRPGVRGYSVCITHRLSVEGLTQRGLRQCQLNSPLLPGVAEGRSIQETVGGWPIGVR